MNLIVVLCIVVAAVIWRVAFWRYVTRGANKSWTLLSDRDVKSFLNSSTFMIGVLWLFTYFWYVEIDPILPPDPLTIGIKAILLVASLFFPTIGATLELRFQTSQEMQEMDGL
jgi:hypothetical protein